jgi:hypothetical protein
MIVFAHEYRGPKAAVESDAEYKRFLRWQPKEAAAEVSAWRAMNASAAGSRWWIVVVDESEGGRCLTEFDWTGVSIPLPYRFAVAIIQRRLELLLDGWLSGESRVTRRSHYGESIAPRLREDGVWEQPVNVG